MNMLVTLPKQEARITSTHLSVVLHENEREEILSQSGKGINGNDVNVKQCNPGTSNVKVKVNMGTRRTEVRMGNVTILTLSSVLVPRV
jgi:hypothetical protein